MPLLRTSWCRAWQSLQGQMDEDRFNALLNGYRQTHRHYHTLQHIEECITHLESVRKLAQHPGELEIALWYHDAVYDPRAPDNELQSANWACETALAAGLTRQSAERIRELILVTRHSALPSCPDQRLLVDIDLAVLGSTPDRFDDYERQVRKEYDWLSNAIFCRKRAAILAGFLARPNLYATPHFRTQLETQARANLTRSIAQLSS